MLLVARLVLGQHGRLPPKAQAQLQAAVWVRLPREKGLTLPTTQEQLPGLVAGHGNTLGPEAQFLLVSSAQSPWAEASVKTQPHWSALGLLAAPPQLGICPRVSPT